MSTEKNDRSPPALHSAGAIVRYDSPFAELEVAQLHDRLPEDLIERWIKPLYMPCLGDVARLEGPLAPLYGDIDERLVRTLLSYFDWRPRIVGGCLAALRGLTGVEEMIGRLLLRSDVCYAGKAYCFALVRFNTPESVAFLREYLNYYLRREDLWFDQMDALAALRCLDEINGTQHALEVMPRWHTFALSKPNWDIESHERRFRKQLVSLCDLAARFDAR